MKKYRKIIIRNPKLRNFRNNLRYIINKAYSDTVIEINKEQMEIVDNLTEKKIKNSKLEERMKYLETRRIELKVFYDRSICICNTCRKIDQDMVYVIHTMLLPAWYCIDCYEKMKRKTPAINSNKPIYLIQSGIFILTGSEKHIWNHENHKTPMTMNIEITIFLFSANGLFLYLSTLKTVRII